MGIWASEGGTGGGDMTAQEILDALKTVDGTGSGLDADYLRGSTGAEFWKAITAFTATPASTSTLTLTSDLTATIKPGVGLRYTISGTVYYGLAAAITSNLLTVAGAPLSGDVTALSWLTTPIINYPEMFVDGEFTTSSQVVTAFKTNLYLPVSPRWRNMPARLVRVTIATANDDTGATTQATVNIRIAGNAVLSTALTIPDSVRTASVVQINTANNRIVLDDLLELEINPPSGGTPAYDAADLLVELDFVPEVI